MAEFFFEGQAEEGQEELQGARSEAKSAKYRKASKYATVFNQHTASQPVNHNVLNQRPGSGLIASDYDQPPPDSISMSECSILDRHFKSSAVPSAKPQPLTNSIPPELKPANQPPSELQFETVFENIPAFCWDQIIIEDTKQRIYKPKVYFTNGSCYKGQWLDGRRDGLGV